MATSIPSQSVSSRLPIDLCISLGTIPVLFLVCGSKTLCQIMQEMGQASEEVFRGDRLPVLHIRTMD